MCAPARSPLSGMLHAGLPVSFMMVAAPLASYMPLSALAGVLVVVCWYMAEKEEFAAPAHGLARRRGADRHLRPDACSRT